MVLLMVFSEPGTLSSSIYPDSPSRATSMTTPSTVLLFSPGSTIFLHLEFPLLDSLLLPSWFVSHPPLEVSKPFQTRCHASVFRGDSIILISRLYSLVHLVKVFKMSLQDSDSVIFEWEFTLYLFSPNVILHTASDIISVHNLKNKTTLEGTYFEFLSPNNDV